MLRLRSSLLLFLGGGQSNHGNSHRRNQLFTDGLQSVTAVGWFGCSIPSGKVLGFESLI